MRPLFGFTISKIKGIVENQRAEFILLALPNDIFQADQVYAGIKTQVKIPSKCFSSYTLRQRARKDLTGYIKLNTLAMLVENGIRFWGLANPLNFEVQFGFDVARTKAGSLMGATVITASTASNIRFAYDTLDKRDAKVRREEIPTATIGKFIFKELEAFYAENQRLPARILFQRDGRFFDEEIEGIEKALKRLTKKFSGATMPNWAAVAIQKKSSIKLRIQDMNAGKMGRPFSGSYILQNRSVGHLITAGAPSLRSGTPNPMQVEYVTGNNNGIEMTEILQDIFALSQLNWNTPDVDISLPITLRFADQKLERYAVEFSNENEDDGWIDEIDYDDEE